LQSPVQAVADILFVVVLGLVIGVPFTFGHLGVFGSATIHFWNSLTIAAICLMVERAKTQGYGFGVTTRSSRFRDAAKVWTLAFAGFLFCLFALKTNAAQSRGYLIALYVGGLATFSFWRALAAPAIARVGRKFWTVANDYVVVGDIGRPGIRQFVDELDSSESGASSLILLNPLCSDTDWPREQQRVLSEACRALHGTKYGAVYVCSAGLPLQRLDTLCRSLSILPVGTYVVPDSATAGLARCRAFAVGNRVAFELRRPPLSRGQQIAKRTFDIVIGLTALFFLSPFMAAAAIAVRLDSKGPIFFRQTRTGQGGKQFRIFKFRSMYVLEDGATIQQACRDDPRVTRVGRFLRASSIDELPQIFNVLKGEMSLVGPRPHAVAHDQQYAQEIPNYELRQHVKPGITGWAQVNGLRGETADIERMHRRIEFDVWYALNASLLLDFEILARTVIEVCRPRNAY
jgi:Undecaprenyl-phosphate glucose phosphotransferase